MMVKLGGWDPWGVLGRVAGRAVEPVRVARDGALRGADRAAFTKRAGGAAHALLAAVDAGALRPGEFPVHTPIVWATETASANRNGDGFRKRACDRYHGTFVTRGRWFRHHDHHPDSPSYGRIVAAAYDPAGGRVDLLVGLNATKEAAAANRGHVADVELEKLARGEDLPTSMGCKVPGDVCSACGNFARHRGEYCGAECPAGGCRTKLGQVVSVGGDLHHLHVDNPDPTWFDASYVGRPAAPYAFAAKADWLDTPDLAVDLARVKLAAAERGGPAPAAEDPALVGLKLAGLLGAVAAAGVALPLPPDRPPHPALAALSFRDPLSAGRSARALADEAVVLPLPAFAKAAGRDRWAAAAAPLALRPDRLPAGPLLAALAAGRYAPAGAAPFDLRMAAKSAASALSVAPARFALRAAFADGPPVGLRAAAPDPAAADPEAVRLAVDHAAYKVAALVDRAPALGADFGLAVRLAVWQELVAARG